MFSSISNSQDITDPDPLRFESEIQTFLEFDSKNTPPQNAVLFVGSSSIRLWKTAISFSDYNVINRGFGGSHTSDLLYFYDSLIKVYDPELIVLYIGENDIAAGKPMDQALLDYKELVRRIRSDHPTAHTLFISIKASSSRWDDWGRMREFNERVREFSYQTDRHHYIDMATSLQNNQGLPDDRYFLEDRLHLNDLGYQVWNRLFIPFADSLLN
ncbi:MAG: GDSL-type esterase/lipase family protein [Balneolaceae bacterium]